MAEGDELPSGTEIDSTVEAAAEKIAALFAADEAEPDDEGEIAADAEAPEEEADAEEDAPADEEAEAPEPAAPAPIRLSDGTELTVEEVEKGYLRQSDYTRKTQALAEQRKAAEAEFEGVRAERALYAEQLGRLTEVLQGNAPVEPPAELRQTDPAEWTARKQEVLAYELQLAKVAGERQRVQEQMARDAEAKHAQYLATERERLFEAFPEWATNRDKAQQDMNALRATGAEYGFSDAELDSVADHRAIRLLHDAMQYRKLKAEQSAAKAKVQPKIAKAPVLKPGSTGKVGPKPTTDIRRAQERLKSTGKLDDAARAIAALGI